LERLKSKITERWKSIKGKYCILWLKFYRIQGMKKAKIKKSSRRLWSEDEIKLLKKMYPGNSPKDIANELGRTVAAVVSKGCQLGLGKKPRVWSKRELNLLKKLYPNKMAKEIAEQLGRPVKATEFRIFKLGLKKRRLAKKN